MESKLARGVCNMAIAYLGLGANVGDRLENMRSAIAALQSSANCRVERVSSLYESGPVGVTEQPSFLNAVCRIDFDGDCYALLSLCKDLEKRLGRKRTIRWGPRVIDIDILLFEGTHINTEALTIPHIEMKNRPFVIIPLCEVAPDADIGQETACEAARTASRDDLELVSGPEWSGL